MLPDGLVVTGGYDGQVRLRSLQSNPSGTLLACSAYALATSLSPSGARLFIGHAAGGISCWEVRQRHNPSPLAVSQRSDSYWRATFDNPPLNLIDPETIPALRALMDTLEADPAVKAVVFDSADEDYFIAHFDVARGGELPGPGPTGLPAWADLASRLTRAPEISTQLFLSPRTVEWHCTRCSRNSASAPASSSTILPRPQSRTQSSPEALYADSWDVITLAEHYGMPRSRTPTGSKRPRSAGGRSS